MPVYRKLWLPSPPRPQTALIPNGYTLATAAGSVALTGIDVTLAANLLPKSGVSGAITSPGIFRKRFPYERARAQSPATLLLAGINYTVAAVTGNFVLSGQAVADLVPISAARYNCLLRG